MHYEGWGMEYDEWVPYTRLVHAPRDISLDWVGPHGLEEEAKWRKVKTIGMHGSRL